MTPKNTRIFFLLLSRNKFLAKLAALATVCLFMAFVLQPQASVIQEEGNWTKRVIGIENLQVKDKVFDVEFVGGSFNDHFDPSGADESKIIPAFWHDANGANCAALSISIKLGFFKFLVNDSTYKSDSFYLPFKLEGGNVYSINDRYNRPNHDEFNSLYIDERSPYLDARDSFSVPLIRRVLKFWLVGNAHPTVYQGFRQSKNARFSVPLPLIRFSKQHQ